MLPIFNQSVRLGEVDIIKKINKNKKNKGNLFYLYFSSKGHLFYCYALLLLSLGHKILALSFGNSERQNSKMSTLWYTALDNRLNPSIAKPINTIEYNSYDCITVYGQRAFANVVNAPKQFTWR